MIFYYLVSALKRRLILELRDSFQAHPLYAKIVPSIQNKYVFSERPQFGIVVKGSSANKVALSGDNFMGTVVSHVMLSYVGEPTYPIEWVREDRQAVSSNGDVFPSPPGLYYIEILSVPENVSDSGTFAIDPLLEAFDEAVLRFRTGIEKHARVENLPLRGTFRLYLNKRILLTEGQDYTLDYTTGDLAILLTSSPGSLLTADYFYTAPSRGPIPWKWNTSDSQSIPGAVLAFGKRGKVGDKVALRVYPDRVESAQAFGGKFEATFELDVIARDPTQMEEVADLVIMYLWGQKKSRLEFEGIEIIDISMGGEAEEVYDETADNYYYNASVSIQLRADWEIHVPLPLTLSKVTQSLVYGGTQDGPASLFFTTAPIMAGRNNSFERIT